MDPLKELSEFLKIDAREDLKIVALHELLAVTGSPEGCDSILKHVDILKSLIECLDNKNEVIKKTSCLALVNLTATENGAKSVVNITDTSKKGVIPSIVDLILDPESTAADPACMTLSNITRVTYLAQKVMDYLKEADIPVEKLINAFTKIKYNAKGCKLHYLGPVFSNLSQSPEFRRQIMDKSRCLIQRFLPFTEYEDSLIRRGGIIGTLKNCCFETDYHDWLLGSDVDLLPRLLLPLAGPEEFDEEDMDKLPPELQYLGEDKKREPDNDIRKMLLESILQLCATKAGREFLRSKNTYVILREYHKWEKDREVLLACENVVDILIRKEDEIGEDNLKEIPVPEKYVDQFNEMDKNYINDT